MNVSPSPRPSPVIDRAHFLERARFLKSLDENVLDPTDEKGDFLLNPDMTGRPAVERPRDAAVLVPIIDRGPDVTVLLTRRTDHLPTHAGQVAFPGGKIDPDDSGPIGASLREAEEEIGLDRNAVDLIGLGDPYVTGSGFRIVPVVGIVSPDAGFVPNPEEVAEIFEVPLSFLMNDANHHQGRRMWQGRERRFYVMPYHRHYIWGVTAGIIRTLYDRMFG